MLSIRSPIFFPKRKKYKRVWLENEENRLIQGIRKHGKIWDKVSEVVETRSWKQVQLQAKII